MEDKKFKISISGMILVTFIIVLIVIIIAMSFTIYNLKSEKGKN